MLPCVVILYMNPFWLVPCATPYLLRSLRVVVLYNKGLNNHVLSAESPDNMLLEVLTMLPNASEITAYKLRSTIQSSGPRRFAAVVCSLL